MASYSEFEDEKFFAGYAQMPRSKETSASVADVVILAERIL